MYNASTLQSSILGFFGDSSYQKNNLLDAEKYYGNILKTYSGSHLLEADTLYNLGNTFYRLGEKEKNQKRVKIWKESIGNYTKSLALRTDAQTEENLAFVKEKLQQEERKQEEDKKKEQENKTSSGSENQQKQTEVNKSGSWQQEEIKKDESWKDSKTGSGTEKNETNTGSGKDANKPQSGQNWSNGWSYNPIGWQNKDEIHSNLSPSDKQEVEKYLEDLKQFAKQNGKLLNPEKPWNIGNSISDQIRNFFWNDSFFQDMIPNNDGKKDW